MDTFQTFLNACRNGQKNIVKILLERGDIDLNRRDAEGNTALHYVCREGYRDLVVLLLEKGAGDYWVIGIGVNLKVAPLLVNTLYPAVSLAEAGINVERLDFLRSFIAEFDNYFNLWKTEGFEPIRREWLAHVKSLDEEILVRLEDEELEGIFRGVDEHGSLLLETSGRIRRIYAGDVFYPQRKQIVNE